MANEKNNRREFLKKLQKSEEIKKKKTVVDNFLTGGKGVIPNPIDTPTNRNKKKIKTLDDLLKVKGMKK